MTTWRNEAIDHVLEQMFRRVLHEVQGEPPQLDSVRILNDEHLNAIRIRARFKVEGSPDRFVEHALSRHEIERDRVGPGRALYNADAIWSRCYEDHYVKRMRDAAHAAAVDAYRVGDVDRAEHIRNLSEHLTEHAVANHPRENMTATEVMMRQRQYRVSYAESMSDQIQPEMDRHALRLTEHIERQLMSLMQTNTAPEDSALAARGMSIETLREARIALERLATTPDWRQAFVDGGGVWFGPSIEVGTPEAQERGLQLLKDNLTEEQRASYENSKFFDVTGGESGKTYRIRHGRQMNIEALDKDGKREHGLCALPQGGLVSGDCMLAQKIALELYEPEFLKIANRFR